MDRVSRPDGDPVSRVREFVLSELRRAIAPPGTRLLVVTAAAEAAAPPEGEGSFDAAWVAPDCLEGIDLRALGRRIARALPAGAPVVCVIPGARPSALEWRRAFGGEFVWHPARAMGVLSRVEARWAQRRPLSFGLLAAADHVMGAWPVLRALGDWIVLEGVRR